MRISYASLFTAATLAVILAVVVAFGMEYAGSFLRVNHPEPADVILVLGGGMDDSRYWRAVDLMNAGYADKIVLDAEAGGEKYGKSNAQLASDFLERIHSHNTTVCPAYSDSTFGETEDVERCLAPLKVSSVLIVTSDYHSRRAFDIFRRRLPYYHWSIAAVFGRDEGGSAQRLPADNWWTNRPWAKTIVDEWERLIWWELVDRWRSHLVVQP